MNSVVAVLSTTVVLALQILRTPIIRQLTSIVIVQTLLTFTCLRPPAISNNLARSTMLALLGPDRCLSRSVLVIAEPATAVALSRPMLAYRLAKRKLVCMLTSALWSPPSLDEQTSGVPSGQRTRKSRLYKGLNWYHHLLLV